MPNKEIWDGDNSNPFQNRSGPRGELNTGAKGKFSESQTEFRIRLHAKSIANQYPRLSDFPGIFKEQFGIDISVDAEKQWRRSNMALIQKKKQEMIDSGELEVVIIGPKALAENLQVLMINTTKMLQKIQIRMQSSLDRLAAAEAKKSDVDEARENVKVLADAYSKINQGVVKQMESLASVAGVARGMEKEKSDNDYKKEVSKQDTNFDPSAVVISEEDRAGI